MKNNAYTIKALGIQMVNNVMCNGQLNTWLIWWNTLATRCYCNKINNVTLVWVHPLAPGWHYSVFRTLIHDLGSWPEFLWMVSVWIGWQDIRDLIFLSRPLWPYLPHKFTVTLYFNHRCVCDQDKEKNKNKLYHRVFGLTAWSEFQNKTLIKRSNNFLWQLEKASNTHGKLMFPV